MWFPMQLAAWFVAMVVLMSIIEHQVHARLMHKAPRLFFLKRLSGRRKIFTSHAVKHHGQYREHFHDEPVPSGEDRGIRLNLAEGLLQAAPVSAILCCVSLTAAGRGCFEPARRFAHAAVTADDDAAQDLDF